MDATLEHDPQKGETGFLGTARFVQDHVENKNTAAGS
jgi:hypothetical protein